jgi:hypothetical protein
VRDNVAGPRPADASWTNNAHASCAPTPPRIPGGRSLPRRARPAAQAPRAGAGRELKIPSSDFCLIPRGVAIQIPAISNQRHAAAGVLVGFGSAPVARASLMGRQGRRVGLPRIPKKNLVAVACHRVGVALDEG